MIMCNKEKQAGDLINSRVPSQYSGLPGINAFMQDEIKDYTICK